MFEFRINREKCNIFYSIVGTTAKKFLIKWSNVTDKMIINIKIHFYLMFNFLMNLEKCNLFHSIDGSSTKKSFSIGIILLIKCN